MIYYSASFILILPAIIIAEIPIFRRRTKLNLKRSILLVTWANIVSAIVGIFLSIPYDFGIAIADPYGAGGAALMLVMPFVHFYFSFLIEFRILRHHLKEMDKNALFSAVLWTNAASYISIVFGLIIALILINYG